MSPCGRCPRCGSGNLEYLATHAHCWECNYFPEGAEDLRHWHGLEFRMPKVPGQLRAEERRILCEQLPLSREAKHENG
jgi:hypothetical protein